MSSKDITNFADIVIDRFSKIITDEVFLMIENDRELFQDYLRLVSDTKFDTVNQIIGKKVKVRYKLTKAQIRQNNPKSKLIKSHQVF